jgi:hypothetical protein
MSFQKLTLGEVEFIEDTTGQALGEIFKEGAFPTAKTIAVVALVVKRRTAPETTLDDMRALGYEETLGLFAEVVGGDEAPKAEVTHEERVTTVKRAAT